MANLIGDLATDRAHGVLLPAVFWDVSAEVAIVDVSDWATAVNLTKTAAMGEPVLVCFGTHQTDRCPLSQVAFGCDGAHGVIFSTAADHPDHIRFVERFRQLVRAELLVRVSPRARADAAVSESKELQQ
jgi:hypothetical protein